jgi:hypothetical protein
VRKGHSLQPTGRACFLILRARVASSGVPLPRQAMDATRVAIAGAWSSCGKCLPGMRSMAVRPAAARAGPEGNEFCVVRPKETLIR